MSSVLEAALAWQIQAAKLPRPMEEHKFHPKRKWRFDFAYPDRVPPIAIEVEGGTWRKSRHTSGQGYEDDCTKYSEAALMGWVVLRVTGRQIASGEALALIERALTA